MTNSLEREITGIQQIGCSTCRTLLVVTHDAIGRARYRCPTCEGVAKTSYRHPDDAFMPQGLARVASALPAIRSGQLRCQGCARGVEGLLRFCPSCVQARQAMVHGVRRCLGCGHERERAKGEQFAVRQCGHCPPTRGTRTHRRYPPKSCARCGATYLPTGPRALFCEAGR